ncbi:MAG: LPS-assembly protein LptD [Planctomycetota bacterium]|jgi:hypothetical protein
MRAWRAVIAGVVLLAGFAPRCALGEEGPPLVIDVDAVVQVESVSSDEEGKAFAVIGTIRLERKGIFSVRARRIVIWTDPRADANVLKIIESLRGKKGALPIWAVRAIYAEGGRTPAFFQAGGHVIRASSLYYDMRAHHGVFLDAELRMRRTKVGPLEEDLPDLVFRAKKFRATGPGSWTAHDVALSSTDYVKPEVELRVKRLRIENDQLRKALGKLTVLSARDEESGTGPTTDELTEVADELADAKKMQQGTRGKLTGVQARAFRIPFFGWKRINIDGGKMDNIIARISVGDKGSIEDGLYLGGGKKTKPIGWYVGAGYFKNRGPLVDTELWLNAWEGRLTGYTTAAYFNDKGTDFNGFVPPSEHRYWTMNRYRFDWTPNLRFDAELSLLSDSQFLRIYDERQVKEGKDQETLGYFRYKNQHLFGTLIYKWRTIDFQEEKDQLPAGAVFVPNLTLLRFGEDGMGRPILLQLAVSSELANNSFRTEEGSPAPDFRTVRWDIDPRLFVAFNIGAVRITPFAAFRFTGYEETLDGSSEARYAGSAGIRGDIQFGRWYGDIQHIVNLVVEYEDMYDVTLPPDDIYDMDVIDQITPWEGLGVRMRNRFFERTGTGRRQLLNFDLYGTWFPDQQRPLGRTGDGFVELDLEWFPSYEWLVEARAQYDWGTGTLATGNLGGRYIPRDDLRFFGAIRHLEDDSDVVSGGTEFEVDQRWRFVLFSQYDIKNDEALDQALLIQRMGQTFMLGVNIRYKVGEDRFTFSFKFDLLERFRSERRKKAQEDLRREVFYNSPR